MKTIFFIVIFAVVLGFFLGRFFVPDNKIVPQDVVNISSNVTTIAIDTQDSKLKVFHNIFINNGEKIIDVLKHLEEDGFINFVEMDDGFVLEGKKSTEFRNWIIYMNGELVEEGFDAMIVADKFFELQYETISSTDIFVQ